MTFASFSRSSIQSYYAMTVPNRLVGETCIPPLSLVLSKKIASREMRGLSSVVDWRIPDQSSLVPVGIASGLWKRIPALNKEHERKGMEKGPQRESQSASF